MKEKIAFKKPSLNKGKYFQSISEIWMQTSLTMLIPAPSPLPKKKELM